MIDLKILFVILGIHWFADFVMQSDEEARNKSKDWWALLSHTITYSFIWFIYSVIYAFYIKDFTILWFAPITFLFHTTTDYFTSRLNARLYKNNQIHDFFVSIGFDQLLHYIQLFLTYYYLTR